MDPTTGLLALITCAGVGIVATLGILRRGRAGATAGGGTHETRFAVSTEGMTRCQSCGMGNLTGDVTCSSCGRTLRH